MPEMKKPFSITLQVRDYECDIQGIVNNAVYQNYLEHARHEFIKTIGLDFAALHARGIDPVVYRVELDYKKALRPGDTFDVSVAMEQEGRLKIHFLQKITRGTDDIMHGRVTAVFTDGRRPIAPPPEVADAMLKWEGRE